MLGYLSIALCASLFGLCKGWITVSSNEWGELSRSLDGKVLLPTDDDYESNYLLWASTFDDVFPMAIIYCESTEDVQKAYQLVLDHFEPDEDISKQIISLRCGKHSMIGASTTSGIVIDVSGLQTLEITDDGTVIVAPGVNLSTFTAWAEEHDVTLPHGDCASVTFGGFLQGGGLGLTSRTFGMGADWVKSIEMVLSNGDLVTATADNEFNDLFWATLGGGGGNFGIITKYEMNIPEKTQSSPGLYVELTWDLTEDNWRAVSAGWKQFMNNAAYQDHFATYLRIQPITYLTQEYYVGLHGFWTGEQTSGLLVLAELLSEIDITPATAKIDLNVHFEGWIESSSDTRIRYSSQCKSRWAFEELESKFFDALHDSVTDLISYSPLDTLLSDDDDDSYVYPTQFMFIAPADGAISTADTKDDISFPFRDARYFFAMCGRWRDGYTYAEDTMKTWLDETMHVLEPHLSTYSFVSFPDWDLANWQQSYFRDNYQELQEIKAKYDPIYMFRYSQSIVPANWPLDDNNDNYKLKYQRASYKKDQADTLYAITGGADADADTDTDAGAVGDGSTEFLNAKAARVANKANKANKHAASNNGSASVLITSSSTMKLIGLVLSIIVIGYGVFYLLFKRNRNGYKSLNDDNDEMETEYNEPLHRDTAIAL